MRSGFLNVSLWPEVVQNLKLMNKGIVFERIETFIAKPKPIRISSAGPVFPKK